MELSRYQTDLLEMIHREKYVIYESLAVESIEPLLALQNIGLIKIVYNKHTDQRYVSPTDITDIARFKIERSKT